MLEHSHFSRNRDFSKRRKLEKNGFVWNSGYFEHSGDLVILGIPGIFWDLGTPAIRGITGIWGFLVFAGIWEFGGLGIRGSLGYGDLGDVGGFGGSSVFGDLGDPGYLGNCGAPRVKRLLGFWESRGFGGGRGDSRVLEDPGDMGFPRNFGDPGNLGDSGNLGISAIQVIGGPGDSWVPLVPGIWELRMWGIPEILGLGDSGVLEDSGIW